MLLAAVVGALIPAGSARAAVPMNVTNRNTLLCIAARAGSGSGDRPAIATTCDYSTKPPSFWVDQHWILVGPGLVQIISGGLQGPMCLTARGYTETQVVATLCENTTDPFQWWSEQHDADNTWQLVNGQSGLCLASRAGTGERPVIATTCDFTVNPPTTYWGDQHWYLSNAGTAP
jgi:hypothetical protein